MKKRIFVQSTPNVQQFPKYKKVVKKSDTPKIKKSCCGKMKYD